MMRLISAILWRLLLVNAWGLVGSAEQILELGARRMAANMLRWFEEHLVPQDRRAPLLLWPCLATGWILASGAPPTLDAQCI